MLKEFEDLDAFVRSIKFSRGKKLNDFLAQGRVNARKGVREFPSVTLSTCFHRGTKSTQRPSCRSKIIEDTGRFRISGVYGWFQRNAFNDQQRNHFTCNEHACKCSVESSSVTILPVSSDARAKYRYKRDTHIQRRTKFHVRTSRTRTYVNTRDKSRMGCIRVRYV